VQRTAKQTITAALLAVTLLSLGACSNSGGSSQSKDSTVAATVNGKNIMLREVEQAAEILGASRWRTVFEIVLPLIRSGLVATFLFILILTWSEYLLALIITKTQVSTLPIELSKYQGSTEGRVYGRQAALAVGITIPLMIVGIIIRKHLARGFSFGMVRR